jgi:hypothetical protein
VVNKFLNISKESQQLVEKFKSIATGHAIPIKKEHINQDMVPLPKSFYMT